LWKHIGQQMGFFPVASRWPSQPKQMHDKLSTIMRWSCDRVTLWTRSPVRIF
jgi:hypothetical protein